MRLSLCGLGDIVHAKTKVPGILATIAGVPNASVVALGASQIPPVGWGEWVVDASYTIVFPASSSLDTAERRLREADLEQELRNADITIDCVQDQTIWQVSQLQTPTISCRNPFITLVVALASTYKLMCFPATSAPTQDFHCDIAKRNFRKSTMQYISLWIPLVSYQMSRSFCFI